MKRILAVIVLLQACLRTGLPAQSIPTPPPLDYLIVVDTSYSMSRLDDQVCAWVHDLIATGFEGRIQPNQSYSIWTFNEKVHSQLFSPKIWSPELNRLLAADSIKFLKIQRFEKQTFLNKAIQEIKQALTVHPDLTIFLVSDGKERLQGTPFDQQIRAACLEVVPRIGRARRPLILTFVACNGQFVAWSLSLAGNPVQFPDLTFLEDRQPHPSKSESPEVAPAPKPVEVLSSTALKTNLALPVVTQSTPQHTSASKPVVAKQESVAKLPAVPSPSDSAPGPQFTAPSTGSQTVATPPASIVTSKENSLANTLDAEVSKTPDHSILGANILSQSAAQPSAPQSISSSVDFLPEARSDEVKGPQRFLSSTTSSETSRDAQSPPPVEFEIKPDATSSKDLHETVAIQVQSSMPGNETVPVLPAPQTSPSDLASASTQAIMSPGPNALVSPFPVLAKRDTRFSMMIAGTVFLLSAVLVFWVYSRKSRAPRPPSLISQSLNRK